MLPALVAIAAWTPALMGLGSWAAADLDEDLRPAVAGLCGLATIAALGTLANFWVAAGGLWPAALMLCGWAVLLLARRTILPGSALHAMPPVLAVAVVCAALSQFPAAGGKGYDAGLYHLQAVQWIAQHPQPPGLANLLGFLGYNVSWFVVAAFLEAPGLAGKSGFFVNALPILFAAWLGIAGLRRLAAGETTLANGFLAVLVVPSALAVESLGFPGYDDPATLLAFASLALWALALERASSRGVLAATLLSVFALTVKLSSAAVVLGALGALLALRQRVGRSRLIAACALATSFASLWLVRGVLSSGCVVYPAASTCLVLPWTVTRQNADSVAEAIFRFARAPPLEMAGVLTPIARHVPYLAEAGRLPLLLLLAATSATMLVAGWRERAILASPAARFVAATCCAGVLYWLVTAPNPRFGVTYLLPLALLPGAAAIASSDRARARRAARVLLAAAAVYLAAGGGWTLRLLRPAEVAVLRWPAYPTVALGQRAARSGLEVNVPVGSIQCWTAPLPCTPLLDERLAWRGMFTIERE